MKINLGSILTSALFLLLLGVILRLIWGFTFLGSYEKGNWDENSSPACEPNNPTLTTRVASRDFLTAPFSLETEDESGPWGRSDAHLSGPMTLKAEKYPEFAGAPPGNYASIEIRKQGLVLRWNGPEHICWVRPWKSIIIQH